MSGCEHSSCLECVILQQNSLFYGLCGSRDQLLFYPSVLSPAGHLIKPETFAKQTKQTYEYVFASLEFFAQAVKSMNTLIKTYIHALLSHLSFTKCQKKKEASHSIPI